MVERRSSTHDISNPLGLLAAFQKQAGLVHSKVKIAISVLSPLDSRTFPSAGAQSVSTITLILAEERSPQQPNVHLMGRALTDRVPDDRPFLLSHQASLIYLMYPLGSDVTLANVKNYSHYSVRDLPQFKSFIFPQGLQKFKEDFWGCNFLVVSVNA